MNHLINKNIAFLGAGHLAKMMIEGLISKGFKADQIWASNKTAAKLEAFANLKINCTTNNLKIVENCPVLILAVRPNQILDLLDTLKPKLKNHLIISVAAGISSEKMIAKLAKNQALIRAMPNTPSSIAQGMTGLWANQNVSENDKQITSQIFKALGEILWLKNEDLMHAITAISGSGPAYFFYFMANMLVSAKKLGLSENEARKLVIQTAKGAVLLAEKSDKDLSQFVSEIALPGGTTEQAINHFKKMNLEEITDKAIQASFNKSKNI